MPSGLRPWLHGALWPVCACLASTVFQLILAAGCWLEGFGARELASARPCDFPPFSRVLWGVRACVASPCWLLVSELLQPVGLGFLTLRYQLVIVAIQFYVWVSHDIC